MTEFCYRQTIFLRFTVTLLHSNLDEKITSKEQKVTSKEQKVTSNEQKVRSNQQKVTSNQQKVTNNEQKVTINEQKITSDEQKITSNEQKVTSNEQKVQPLWQYTNWSVLIFLTFWVSFLWTGVLSAHFNSNGYEKVLIQQLRFEKMKSLRISEFSFFITVGVSVFCVALLMLGYLVL